MDVSSTPPGSMGSGTSGGAVAAAPLNTGGGLLDKAIPIAVGNRTQLCLVALAVIQLAAAFGFVSHDVANEASTVLGGLGGAFFASKVERGTPDAVETPSGPAVPVLAKPPLT